MKNIPSLITETHSEDIKNKLQFDTNIFTPNDIIEDAEKLEKGLNEVVFSKNLQIVLATHLKLKDIKSNEIIFSAPILKQGENAVIFPHTINVIQGQAGVHKSRLAENICSAFLKLHKSNNELLGFKRTSFDTKHTVVYIDTERNLAEQLPFALQNIQKMAGYEKAEHPLNYEYASLLQIDRKQRFSALNEYLDHIRKSTDTPLFIVLDVSTDCIEDFNKTDKDL